MATVVFWVTWMYHRVTQMYDKVVRRAKGNWVVLHMGMLVPHVDVDSGDPDI